MRRLKNIGLGLLLFTFFVNVVHAEVISFVDCEYREEYLKWLELSEEDKKKFEEPAMCKDEEYPAIKGVSISEPRYFLKDVGRLSDEIRNQGVASSCWAFATTESISSSALSSGIHATYSPGHMELLTQNTYAVNGLKTFNRTANGGGNYFVSSAYVTNYLGPVLESSFPFFDISGNENDYLNYLNSNSKTVSISKPAVDVNQVLLGNNPQGACSSSAKTFIKEYLKEHGALAAQLYFDEGGSHKSLKDLGDGTYSLSNDFVNGAYYYYDEDTDKISNHGVTIVGWDDTILPDAFSSYHKPKNAGAWIVKNSYGESYQDYNDKNQLIEILEGDHGYFYVSYEDVNICTSLAGFYDVDSDVSDTVYSYDYLGWNGTLDAKSSEFFLANKFDKKTSGIEKLDKVTFGTAEAGQQYEVYYSSTGNLNSYAKLGEGTTSGRGYETFKVSGDIILGDHFAILVKLKEQDKVTIVAAGKYTSLGSYYENYNIVDQVSYMSEDGRNWTLSKSSSSNIQNSIKAYTSTLDSVPTTPTTPTEETTTPTTEEPTIEVKPNENNSEPIPDYVEPKTEDSNPTPTIDPTGTTDSSNGKQNKSEKGDIENPNTGSFVPGVVLGGIALFGLGILYQTKRKQKLFKM